MFHGSFKGVSRKFKGCFKKISRKFQKNFNGVSIKNDESFKGDIARVFQRSLGSFRSVLRLFQGNLKHIKSLSKKVCFVVVVVAASLAEGGLVFLISLFLETLL